MEINFRVNNYLILNDNKVGYSISIRKTVIYLIPNFDTYLTNFSLLSQPRKVFMSR